ncbi:hypothetical protein P3S68_016786 [Capsicum galapagoense]
MKEENNLARLGGSLPVPSVQELAKGSLENVPLRYLRDDHQLAPPIMIKSDDNIQSSTWKACFLGMNSNSRSSILLVDNGDFFS